MVVSAWSTSRRFLVLKDMSVEKGLFQTIHYESCFRICCLILLSVDEFYSFHSRDQKLYRFLVPVDFVLVEEGSSVTDWMLTSVNHSKSGFNCTKLKCNLISFHT